jgi:GTP cyclohydrolase I
MARNLTHGEIGGAAYKVARHLLDLAIILKRNIKAYPIPRGGIPALYCVERCFLALTVKGGLPWQLLLVDNLTEADAVVDDLVDSGNTQRQILSTRPGIPFFPLFTKGVNLDVSEWVVFPWEVSMERSVEDVFVRLIEFCGEDPARGGLLETPTRMAKAWQFWTSGYQKDYVKVLKSFEDGGENYDEMIHVKHVPFYSQCEHHMAPFFGEVTFAYVPDKHIVGLSKMSRLVDVFSRRLQVQERLTVQIVDAFCEVMNPKGAGCIISARHLCMESRGICQQGITTTTSALRGVFKESTARAEFLSLSQS